MAYMMYNPNKHGLNVGDCAVRAIAKALHIGWNKAYVLLSVEGYRQGDMPNSDAVWGNVLRNNGFERHAVPNTCPMCYTTQAFCRDHPKGIYVLGFGGHVATVIDGDLYDSWDSSGRAPQFYWYRSG